MITIERASFSDAEEAVAMQRENDPHPRTVGFLRQEIAATPEPWVALWDGHVAAVFGIRPVDGEPGVGSCWLMTTTKAKEAGVAFARDSRRIWSVLSQGWDRVIGVTPQIDMCARLWQRRLGFQITHEENGLIWFEWSAPDGH